jgi:hypothetical protein
MLYCSPRKHTVAGNLRLLQTATGVNPQSTAADVDSDLTDTSELAQPLSE